MQTPQPQAGVQATKQPKNGLGAVIRAARERTNLSQRELAERAGTHQPIISKVERGDLTKVGRETFERVVRVVGLDEGAALAEAGWTWPAPSTNGRAGCP
jgi:transcriptional regulator with XRE-family HTH domain